MDIVDVHAHLESEKFEKDLDEVVARFKEAGGKFVINSGTDPGRNRETLELSEKYDIVKCSFGMYPVGDYDDVDGELAWIEEHADVCVAIGEIGLDFDNEERKANANGQKDLFRKMLGLAKKLDKPVVIHSRAAELEVVEILEEMGFGQTASLSERGDAPVRSVSPVRSLRCQSGGKGKVVMHCFCGKRGLIKRCVENGWSFSVPPVIKRWDNFKMLVKIVPLDKLLTETDAPYLGADAKERNEPANVVVTVGEIARIKGVSVDEVATVIFNNAEGLFGL